jgi:nucleotide-binding universal stress UspA family protein
MARHLEAYRVPSAAVIVVADRFQATVHVLYVLPSGRGSSSPSDPRRIQAGEVVRSVAARAEQRGLTAKTYVQSGTPHDRIRRFVSRRGIDLVSVGTHGRSGVERYFLGSVTEKVLRTSDASVVTARATKSD